MSKSYEAAKRIVRDHPHIVRIARLAGLDRVRGRDPGLALSRRKPCLRRRQPKCPRQLSTLLHPVWARAARRRWKPVRAGRGGNRTRHRFFSACNTTEGGGQPRTVPRGHIFRDRRGCLRRRTGLRSATFWLSACGNAFHGVGRTGLLAAVCRARGSSFRASSRIPPMVSNSRAANGTAIAAP